MIVKIIKLLSRKGFFKIKFLFVVLFLLSGCSNINQNNEFIKKIPLKKIDMTTHFNSVWVNHIACGMNDNNSNLTIASNKNKIFYCISKKNHNGTVYSIDKKSGIIDWFKEIKSPIVSGVSYGDGALLISTSDPKVLSLDERTGNILWEVKLESEVLGGLSVNRGFIYYTSIDGALTSMNALNGSCVWRYSTNSPQFVLKKNGLPVLNDNAVFAGFPNGRIAAINLIDGSELWSRNIGFSLGKSELQKMTDITSTPILYKDKIYSVSYRGKLCSMNALNGSVNWERPASSYSGITIFKNLVIISKNNGNIVAYNTSEKNEEYYLWKSRELKGRKLSKVVVYNDDLLTVGDSCGDLYFLSTRDGKLVGKINVCSSAIECDPIVDGDTIYVLSLSGKISSFKIR